MGMTGLPASEEEAGSTMVGGALLSNFSRLMTMGTGLKGSCTTVGGGGGVVGVVKVLGTVCSSSV